MDKLYVWLSHEQPRHPPKSLMGNAIRYTLKVGKRSRASSRTPKFLRTTIAASAPFESLRSGAKIFSLQVTKKREKISPRSTRSSRPASPMNSIPSRI